ncbi:MAG: hypothetical protein CMI26_10680 [Opitutae bacterium]|nr:hypothetical protein [Opitutae bacterium]
MPCSIHQGRSRIPCKFCDEDGCLQSASEEAVWMEKVLLNAKDSSCSEVNHATTFVKMLMGKKDYRNWHRGIHIMTPSMKTYLLELEGVGMKTSLDALAVKLLLIHTIMTDFFNRSMGEEGCHTPCAWAPGCVEAGNKTPSYAAAKTLLRIREYALCTRWPLKVKGLWAVLYSILRKLSMHEVRWAGSMWPHHEKLTGSVSHECKVDETLYTGFFMSRSGRYFPVPSLKRREHFQLRPSEDAPFATTSANRMAALLIFAKEVTSYGAHCAMRDTPPEWVVDFLACKEAIHMSMASPLLYGWDLSIVVHFRVWNNFGYNPAMRLSKFVFSEKPEEEFPREPEPAVQPACMVYGEKFCKRRNVMRFLLQYREVEEQQEEKEKEERPSKKPRRSRSQPPPRAAGSRERIPALTAEEKEALKRRCVAMAGGVTARATGISLRTVGQRPECVVFDAF